jgi:hypothetical protein
LARSMLRVDSEARRDYGCPQVIELLRDRIPPAVDGGVRGALNASCQREYSPVFEHSAP